MKKIGKKHLAVGLSIIVLFAATAIFANKNGQNEEKPQTKESAKEVAVINIDKDKPQEGSLEAVGTVKADSEVSILAMQPGTVRSVFFSVGDTINRNQTLANLSEDSISTGLINAETDYYNRQNNLEIAETSGEQSIAAAEIGLANAAESLKLAETQLQTAKDNYDNGLKQTEKNKIDAKNNALINYNNNISFIFDVLEEVDYIIDIEDSGDQLAGIDKVIAAKDKSSLNKTKRLYLENEACYLDLVRNEADEENALKSIGRSIECLKKTKQTLDGLLEVLDNTVTSSKFPESVLKSNITKFNQLRISTLGTESQAKSAEQALENIDINNKSETDRLKNALAAAQNQFALSEIAYKNAELNLKKARSGADQQLVAAQIALDSSAGQLSLARQRAGDLRITSPIEGVVTEKEIQIGDKLSTGQKIAKVSNLNIVKILSSLPSEEAYKVKLGQEVLIENKYRGFISQINPAADARSKKIELEVSYDNSGGELIAETFVDLEIKTEIEKKSANGFYLVPLRAVSIGQNENSVFLASEGKAVKKEVEVGEVQGKLVEIRKGLAAGDKLVVDGNKSLQEGDDLEIK